MNLSYQWLVGYHGAAYIQWSTAHVAVGYMLAVISIGGEQVLFAGITSFWGSRTRILWLCTSKPSWQPQHEKLKTVGECESVTCLVERQCLGGIASTQCCLCSRGTRNVLRPTKWLKSTAPIIRGGTQNWASSKYSKSNYTKGYLESVTRQPSPMNQSSQQTILVVESHGWVVHVLNTQDQGR